MTDLRGLPDGVSVWCGPPGGPPRVAHDADRPHYAASVIKVAVLLALDAAARDGRLDLDAGVAVRDTVTALDGTTFTADRGYDSDEPPWERVGTTAPARWLAERMVVASSNLATNVLTGTVGLAAVAAECPAGVRIERQIGDHAARQRGATNTITAAGAAALMAAVLARRDAGRPWPYEVLTRQEHRDGVPAALPPHTEVANKTGWTDDVRHDAAIVTPAGGAPYVLAVCTTHVADAQAVIRDVAAACAARA